MRTSNEEAASAGLACDLSSLGAFCQWLERSFPSASGAPNASSEIREFLDEGVLLHLFISYLEEAVGEAFPAELCDVLERVEEWYWFAVVKSGHAPSNGAA